MIRKIIFGLCVLLLLLVINTPTVSSAFVSPLPPVCPRGQTCGDGFLPWRPTPPPKEPKEVIEISTPMELLILKECIVRARTWGVSASLCY